MPHQFPHLSHPKYRADIDGLRALAILPVVAFHAFPNLVNGGFIGVDVFFVISGYLISTIIFSNLEQDTFSFAEFYGRRIKRIFPALLLVLAASFAFGWFALLADEYKQLGKHITAGAGFISNLVLKGEAGYFDNSAETKPLLHLWSLGIEEQFYIVWPVLLWLAWKKKFNLLTITIVVAAASYYLNVKGVLQDSVSTFYSPQTRFWELLCGSALAWLTLYKKHAFLSAKAKITASLSSIIYHEKQEIDGNILPNMLSFIGLFLLVFGFWRVNTSLSFPGSWALVPVIGAALIISAGPQGWVNRVVLSHRVAVWFGLISFPLYLWHWPLLSFARILESQVPSQGIRIAALLAAVMLAWLTYQFIEKPMRQKGGNKTKVALLCFLMVVVGFVGFNTYRRDGLEFRTANKAARINPFDVPYHESCEQLTGEAYNDDWCNKGTSAESPVNTVVLGDSYSNAYTPMLRAYARDTNSHFSFIQFGRGQCPSLLDYGPAFCRLITQKIFDYVKNSSSVKTVIFSANWPAYYDGKNYLRVADKESWEAFRASLEKTLSAYEKLGKRVVVFLAPPVGSNPRSCVRPFKLTEHNACILTDSVARESDGKYREYLLPLLSGRGLAVYDPFVDFCDGAECKIFDGKRLYVADGGHMSIHGGEFLANKASGALNMLFDRQDSANNR